MKQFMKRLVFVLAVTLSVVGLKQSVFAENLIYVNETTFPDKMLREEVLEQWDEVKPYDFDDDEEDYDDEEGDYNEYVNNKAEDGVKIDADLIKSIYIYSNDKKVTNLKGIEFLTKLESLSIWNYYGPKFDLSKNTNLEEVFLESKKYVLSPNDFASLPKLTYLRMRGKVVSTIDFFKLKNIERISIDAKTGAKKVDISKCTKLKSVYIHSAAATSINIGKLSKLKDLHIEGAKKLTSVNVSKLSNLDDLMIRDCGIKKIDLSKNRKLRMLSVKGNKKLKSLNIKKNINLQDVNIGYTSITKLDTSKNKKLGSLDVYNSKISSLNLKKNTNLWSLKVSDTPIKTLDVKKNARLQYLTITGSKIKSVDMRNQKIPQKVTYSAGQKVLLNKEYCDYCWIRIMDVKKGSSVDVPTCCKGYKFNSSKDNLLKCKNNKIITSKKTKKREAGISFTKGKKSIGITIYYK